MRNHHSSKVQISSRNCRQTKSIGTFWDSAGPKTYGRLLKATGFTIWRGQWIFGYFANSLPLYVKVSYINGHSILRPHWRWRHSFQGTFAVPSEHIPAFSMRISLLPERSKHSMGNHEQRITIMR